MKCNICKRGVNLKDLFYFVEEELFLCPSCTEQLHTCRGCEYRNNCELESNPLNLQIYITTQEKKGNMVFQRQEINSQAIEAYCNKCKCQTNGECCRNSLGYCNNWNLHNDYKKGGNI